MNRCTTFCLSLSICVSLNNSSRAELAFVWLKDGRMLAGEVDSHTDSERLWLRSSAKTFVLKTSASWQSIAAAKIGGKQLTTDELMQVATEIKTAVPEGHGAAKAARHAVTHVLQPRIESNAAARVESIEVEARVANWDRDAQSDGIEIRILPRNVFGNVVPVSGQLLIQLVGRNRLPLRDQDAFPRLGRWSLRTHANDFASRGAVYRLPYRNSKPPTAQTLESLGLVEAQLLVYGQGRFEADAPIYVRRFNPVRDDLRRQRSMRDR